MSLPEQLLLSDLLRRRVRCDQGVDHGLGSEAWMHPPVHRLLGWISKPSAFGDRRLAWRLDQLRGLAEQELFVQGDGAVTDLVCVDRLPTLIGAALIGGDGEVIGRVADAAVELQTGRIRHYLVARSDPRLPGTSRWRLSPDRIVDQQPGQVVTALEGLDDLPLARASVRQEFLRRSRRWRDQVQQASDRFEERLEGWLEEPAEPWQESEEPEPRRPMQPLDPEGPEAWDDWPESGAPPRRDRRPPRPSRRDLPDEDPWF